MGYRRIADEPIAEPTNRSLNKSPICTHLAAEGAAAAAAASTHSALLRGYQAPTTITDHIFINI